MSFYFVIDICTCYLYNVFFIHVCCVISIKYGDGDDHDDNNTLSSQIISAYILVFWLCLQWFDAVGWAVGRASGLKKTEWWGAGAVICLERGADLHGGREGKRRGSERREGKGQPQKYFGLEPLLRRVSASTQLGVNNLPRVITRPRPGRVSNSQPGDHKTDARCHCATTPPRRWQLRVCQLFIYPTRTVWRDLCRRRCLTGRGIVQDGTAEAGSSHRDPCEHCTGSPAPASATTGCHANSHEG